MSDLPTEHPPLGCATPCDTSYLRNSLACIRADYCMSCSHYSYYSAYRVADDHSISLVCQMSKGPSSNLPANGHINWCRNDQDPTTCGQTLTENNKKGIFLSQTHPRPRTSQKQAETRQVTMKERPKDPSMEKTRKISYDFKLIENC